MNSKAKNSSYAKASEDKKKYNPAEIEAKWPRFAKASRGKQKNAYNPSAIESKWQAVWGQERIYSPDLDRAKNPFYNLMMFPYPSAEGMHVGNMYAFTGADVHGRFQRMQGKSVFEPIGLDGFGIHSENYALKAGKHPAGQAKISEKNFYRQLKSTGNSFDWTRTVETYKPEYYKWTQWLFIQLFKAGLAYRKKAPVNFCPSCKTVLADEQVLNARPPATSLAGEVGRGQCERCNSVVEKRDLEQWFFKITKYADRLLNGLSQIDWDEKIKIAQRLWIGKSEGAEIEFRIKDSELKIKVFTTRADTLYGATFLVLSPEHPVLQSSKNKEIQEYIKKAKTKSDSERIENKEKTGVFSGLYAVNPVNQEKIPVWVADFVIGSYGTGAVFADAHDERDFEFAKKYKIALKPTLKTGNEELDKKIKNLEECFTGDGILVDSGEFTGLTSAQARKKIVIWLNEKNQAKPQVTYHLRDWLISRQRYWGPPIPLVFCENCARRIKDKGLMINGELSKGEMENPGWIAVNEEDLPVKLPFIEDYKPLGIHSTSSGQAGKAPLASHPEFYKTRCPKCGGEAKRETDVSDTFLDSSWYFLRYVSTDIDTVAFDKERVKKWLPVNMYIGGAEHSVLHLLYSRFITMVLKDLGFISFEEPFTTFRAHGLLVKDGAKMSKSKGNVVVTDLYVKKFGADTLRTYLMFMGPFSQGGDFRDTGIEGMFRFLKRVWNLVSSIKYQVLSIEGKDTNPALDSFMHKTIKSVTQDIENLSYNTAIAHLMEYYNELSAFYTKYKILNVKYCKTFVLLFAPFAPHISEELYQLLIPKKEFSSIHNSAWPKFDPKFLVKNEIIVVIQVNGKLRGNIKVKSEKLKIKGYIEDLAKKAPNVDRYLETKEIKKVIYVEGKVINFVTA